MPTITLAVGLELLEHGHDLLRWARPSQKMAIMRDTRSRGGAYAFEPKEDWIVDGQIQNRISTDFLLMQSQVALNHALKNPGEGDIGD